MMVLLSMRDTGRVNILHCTTEGVQVVGDEDGSLFLCTFSGKDAVFVVVLGDGYVSVFMWVFGSCLVVSGLEVLIGIDV